MAKPQGLLRFFQQTIKTKQVKVGAKLMELTHTQAYRLNELEDRRRRSSENEGRSGLEQAHYSLEEAAFRLMLDEDDVLQLAIEEKCHLYVDVSGLAGRWMCRSDRGEILQTEVCAMRHGYLAVIPRDVAQMQRQTTSAVSLLELILPADPAAAEIPDDITVALASWGEARKMFRLESPLPIDRARMRLMAPLSNNPH